MKIWSNEAWNVHHFLPFHKLYNAFFHEELEAWNNDPVQLIIHERLLSVLIVL